MSSSYMAESLYSVISLSFSSLLHTWPPLFHSFGIWIWEFYVPPRSGVKQYLPSDWWILSSILSISIKLHDFLLFKAVFPLYVETRVFILPILLLIKLKSWWLWLVLWYMCLSLVFTEVRVAGSDELLWFFLQTSYTYPSTESGTGPHSPSRPSIVLVLLRFKW